jgi:hypothetical protein
VGNYVRLRHGLPLLAAALALLLLAAAPAAHASRHCLDYSEAVRTWPSRALAKEGDECWTYDHHPPRAKVPIAIHEPVPSAREPGPMDRWVDADLIQVELRRGEPDTVSQPILPPRRTHSRARVSSRCSSRSCLQRSQSWRSRPCDMAQRPARRSGAGPRSPGVDADFGLMRILVRLQRPRPSESRTGRSPEASRS